LGVETPQTPEPAQETLEPDEGEPVFHHCIFCNEPYWIDDSRSDNFTNWKQAHRECYEKQRGIVKDFNSNLFEARKLQKSGDE